MEILTLLLLIFVKASCVLGGFQYDLFSVNGLSASVASVKGATAVDGPTGPGLKDTKGIHFASDTGDISLDDITFARIANTLIKSDDVTFAVYFKIDDMHRKETTYFPFFALADSKLKDNFFSIGLESMRDYRIIEGKQEFTGKIRWTLNIEQYKMGSRKTSLPTSSKESLGIVLKQWTVLMVRLKGKSVTVSLNCTEVAKGDLGEGRIGKFSYEGKLTFGKLVTVHGMKQYVGSMYEPQLINGQLAYDYYNPCTSDRTPSKIKPEPRAKDYDASKFNKFQKMSNQENPPPVIYCKDEDGVLRRNNGNRWKKKNSQCHEYKCVDGKIKSTYVCQTCEDDDSGKEYQSGDVWTKPGDKCTQRKCIESEEEGMVEVDETKISCPSLKCKAEDSYTPKGACCPKCHQDDCTQKKIWTLGCDRSCANVDAKCKEKKKGCFCAQKHRMNMRGDECVPIRECACKVDDKYYLPGQSIPRSLCSNCICQHGRLKCFDIC